MATGQDEQNPSVSVFTSRGCLISLGIAATGSSLAMFLAFQVLDSFMSSQIAYYSIGRAAHSHSNHGDRTFPPVLTDKKSPRFDFGAAISSAPGFELGSDELRDWAQQCEEWFDDRFIYVGYAITSMSEAESFASAYNEYAKNGTAMVGDLNVAEGSGNLGSSTLFQLRYGFHAHVAESLNIDEEVVRQNLPEVVWLIERPRFLRRKLAVMTYKHDFIGDMELRRDGEWPYVPEYIELLNSLDREQDQ